MVDRTVSTPVYRLEYRQPVEVFFTFLFYFPILWNDNGEKKCGEYDDEYWWCDVRGVITENTLLLICVNAVFTVTGNMDIS